MDKHIMLISYHVEGSFCNNIDMDDPFYSFYIVLRVVSNNTPLQVHYAESCFNIYDDKHIMFI